MNKAVFLDRDGVINQLVYYEDHGIVDSPFTVKQIQILPNAAEAINKLTNGGYKVIIISNQPGIAKGHFSWKMFEGMRRKIIDELGKLNAHLDGEYYCFHHPDAVVENLKESCECRKPRPGLIFRAAKEHDIDLSTSWMIGDGITDIRAGKIAGCKTVLIGKMKCDLCRLADEMNAKPDVIATTILDAVSTILY